MQQVGEFSTVDAQSKPIQQQSFTLSTVNEQSKPIEQVLELIITEDQSAPIEQLGDFQFPATDGLSSIPPNDSIIEQRETRRSTVDNPDTPIEQVVFVTGDLRDSPPSPGTSLVVEQFDTNRISGQDAPVQQEPSLTGKVDLNLFDFAESIFPPCNSIKNPVNTNILWRIQDNGFSFDLDTLIFKVDGIEVQDSSSFVVTSIDSIPPSTGGLQFDYNPPVDFAFNFKVHIQLDITDTKTPIPNRILYNCSWFTTPDTKAPVISLVSPQCNETDVGVVEPIVFDVLDVGKGVDQSTISVSVEGVTVCSGVSFTSITSTVAGTGFRGTYVHPLKPFRYDSRVSVAIDATDLAETPNSTFFVCCFDVEESNPPEFINIVPEKCATFVDSHTGLKFEVYGDVAGVDISTLEVFIDEKARKVIVKPRIFRSQ